MFLILLRRSDFIVKMEHINPFIESFITVLPQLGFTNVVRKNLTVKGSHLSYSGVVLLLGIVGDVKGNVAYSMSEENAKKIASQMMMGMPVEELNDMAESALSELSNMLTANAGINLEQNGISIDISTPTLMHGKEFTANMNTKQVICVEMLINDDMVIEIDLSIEEED